MHRFRRSGEDGVPAKLCEGGSAYASTAYSADENGYAGHPHHCGRTDLHHSKGYADRNYAYCLSFCLPAHMI